MIEFYDVSTWQNPSNVAALVKTNGDKILAIKASEGASIHDGKTIAHVTATKNMIDVYIFYHFMRCDKNAKNISAEVANFFSAVHEVKERCGIEKAVLALDFERCTNRQKFSDYANPAHREALRRAIEIITLEKGHAPYVYACESEMRGLLNNGVQIDWRWVAKYSCFKPSTICGIWQYTNTGGKIDRNKFFGESIERLKRHAVAI